MWFTDSHSSSQDRLSKHVLLPLLDLISLIVQLTRVYRGSIIYNLRIIYFRDEHGDIFLSNNNFNLINCVEKYSGLLKKFFLLKKERENHLEFVYMSLIYIYIKFYSLLHKFLWKFSIIPKKYMIKKKNRCMVKYL